MACGDIRENMRADLSEHRQKIRDQEMSSKRKDLQEIIDIGRSVTSDEVIIVGNKLKSKSSVKIEDLAILKLAFVQNTNNIISFLRIKGALHGLIRELSSIKSNYQLVAAECCCNLSLGDPRSSLQVAKAAGPYLITMLSGYNSNLINVSVWALGNLVGSDEKTWKVIHAQGFLGKLLQLIVEQDNKDLPVTSDIRYNALEALSHFLLIGLKLLEKEELESIITMLASLKNTSVKGFWLSKYLLTCSEIAEPKVIENKFHVRCLRFMEITDLNKDTIASFTCALRTVGNLVSESSGTCCADIFANWQSLQDSCQKMFSSPYRHLVSELGWLFGNMLNHPSQDVQTYLNGQSSDLELFKSQFTFFST